MGLVFGDITDVRDARKQIYGLRWDDLRFPMGGLNPPGPENEPTVDTETGLYVFPDGSTRILAGLAQMPHAWFEESPVGPHVHWVQTAPGNALFRFDWRVFNAVDCEFPETWNTSYASATTHPYPGSGSWVMITPFEAPDMTGMKISSMILFRVSRVGGDALDTMAESLRLLEFDIHHQLDDRGSVGLFTK